MSERNVVLPAPFEPSRPVIPGPISASRPASATVRAVALDDTAGDDDGSAGSAQGHGHGGSVVTFAAVCRGLRKSEGPLGAGLQMEGPTERRECTPHGIAAT